MNLKIDSDVGAVIEIMQRTIPAARLVSVAQAVSELAPLLWGQYEKEGIAAPLLCGYARPDDGVQQQRSTPIAHRPGDRCGVDGGSGAAADAPQ